MRFFKETEFYHSGGGFSCNDDSDMRMLSRSETDIGIACRGDTAFNLNRFNLLVRREFFRAALPFMGNTTVS